MSEIKYTCYIHKDVTFDELGKCPECFYEEEKKKDFEKNPREFVRVSELIMAAKYDRNHEKMMFVVNPQYSNKDLHYAYGELSQAYREILQFKKMMELQKNESKIIQPNGVVPFKNIKG